MQNNEFYKQNRELQNTELIKQLPNNNINMNLGDDNAYKEEK